MVNLFLFLPLLLNGKIFFVSFSGIKKFAIHTFQKLLSVKRCKKAEKSGKPVANFSQFLCWTLCNSYICQFFAVVVIVVDNSIVGWAKVG